MYKEKTSDRYCFKKITKAFWLLYTLWVITYIFGIWKSQQGVLLFFLVYLPRQCVLYSIFKSTIVPSKFWFFTFGTNATWCCALVLLVLHYTAVLELLAIENKVYLCSSGPGLHAGHITNSGRAVCRKKGSLFPDNKKWWLTIDDKLHVLLGSFPKANHPCFYENMRSGLCQSLG